MIKDIALEIQDGLMVAKHGVFDRYAFWDYKQYLLPILMIVEIEGIGLSYNNTLYSKK